MESKEIRAFNFDIAHEDEGHTISGRAIVFDAPTDMGWYREYIDKGALANTDLKDVRLLVNHNTDMIPLARSRNNTANSTMQLTVTDDGMDIRANLDVENNADAKATYSAVERGDLSGMSFMFTVSGDKWEDIDTDYPTRHITAIRRVFEVSAVTFPAYEQTTLEARGLASALESAKASLESAKAEARAEAQKKAKIKLLCELGVK